MEADGNVMISSDLDTRPVMQSLKDLKKSIEQTFKGTSVSELKTQLTSVKKDINAMESEVRKAEKTLNDFMSGAKEPEVLKHANARIKQTQSELAKVKAQMDALMTGEKTPQSIKVLEKDLVVTQREIDKVAKNFEKARLESEKYSASAGLNPRTSPNAQKYYDAQAALNRYSAEWEKLENHLYETQAQLDNLKQNPALTPEAQAYQAQITKIENKLTQWKELAATVKQNPQASEEVQQYSKYLDEANQKLNSLKAKEEELGVVAERSSARQQLANNNIFTGLGKIEQRIVRLAKRVLFFSVITIALRKLRKQIAALIQSDSELSASLAQVKGNLATAFGDIWLTIVPAIRTLVKWLAIATKYIAAFISWITGKSLKAGQQAFQAASDASKDTAKNTGKIGKAAKKAAKEAERMLLPFDQMNVLSSNKADTDTADTDTGDAAGGLANIEYPKNLDKIIARFEKLKDLIVLIGIAFAAWKLANILNLLTGISKLTAFAGITSLAFGIYLLVTGIKDWIKNGPNFENVTRTIAGALLIVGGAALLLGAAWAPIVIGIGLVIFAFSKLYKHSKKFREFVDGVIKKVKEIGKDIKKAYDEKGLIGVGEYIIKGIWKGIKKAIKGAFKWLKEHIFDPIVDGIKKLFGIESPAKETMPIGEMIIKGIFEGMLKPIKTVGTWIKNHVFNPIKNALFGNKEGKEGYSVKIGTKFTDTKEAITKKWNNLTSNIKDKTAQMKAEVKQKWDSIKKSWTDLTKNVKDKTADMKAKVPQRWANIQSGWTNLTKNVKDKTASMKAKVGSKWSDLRTTWNNLMANFKDKTANVKLNIGTTVQSAKDFVNDIIYKLNTKLGSLKWPKWVPGIGGKWVFSSADPIPYLARGAVIPANKEFLAVLGDQKHGTNIETPLQTMIDAFNTALQQNGMSGNNPDINVYLQGDAKQLFKVVRVEANNYARSTGKAAFEL